ncbi:MAG: hypothetical protein N3G21_10700 [Candidatus Hydrogenedentes bacterium]|nr:hypothetical protein [Candidatus Hydrogenedentota bacterium]
MSGLDYKITKGKEELKSLYLNTLAKESSCEIEEPTNRPEKLKLYIGLHQRNKSTIRVFLADLCLLR